MATYVTQAELNYVCLAILGDTVGMEYVRKRADAFKAGMWGDAGVDRLRERQADAKAIQATDPPTFDAHPDQRAAKAEMYAQLRREGAL